MQGKPNQWMGVILSLVGFQLGLGLFYVGAPWLALASIAIFLGTGGLMFTGVWQGAYPIVLATLALLTVALTYILAIRRTAAQARGWTARWYVDFLLLACTVPAEHYFVLGDNRDNSADSRMFGYVPRKSIIGKVVWSSQRN